MKLEPQTVQFPWTLQIWGGGPTCFLLFLAPPSYRNGYPQHTYLAWFCLICSVETRGLRHLGIPRSREPRLCFIVSQSIVQYSRLLICLQSSSIPSACEHLALVVFFLNVFSSHTRRNWSQGNAFPLNTVRTIPSIGYLCTLYSHL